MSVAIVTELGRRFAAGDGAGALALFARDIRIEQLLATLDAERTEKA